MLEALRNLVPVTSYAQEQPNLPPPAPTPVAGARWGRPGSFNYTAQGPEDVLATDDNRPIIPTWVEIQESDDVLKRTRRYAATVDTNWTTKASQFSSGGTAGTPGQVGYARSTIIGRDIFRRIDNITFLFKESLYKKHLAEQNPIRTFDYSLDFATTRPEDP